MLNLISGIHSWAIHIWCIGDIRMAAGALVKGEPQPRLAQLVVQGAPNVQHIFQGAGDERAAGLHV